MCARNHHWKWWHPFWLSTRTGLCSGFALGDGIDTRPASAQRER